MRGRHDHDMDRANNINGVDISRKRTQREGYRQAGIWYRRKI